MLIHLYLLCKFVKLSDMFLWTENLAHFQLNLILMNYGNSMFAW